MPRFFIVLALLAVSSLCGCNESREVQYLQAAAEAEAENSRFEELFSQWERTVDKDEKEQLKGRIELQKTRLIKSRQRRDALAITAQSVVPQ